MTGRRVQVIWNLVESISRGSIVSKRPHDIKNINYLHMSRTSDIFDSGLFICQTKEGAELKMNYLVLIKLACQGREDGKEQI